MTRHCTQCAHQLPPPAGRNDPLCAHPQSRNEQGGAMYCYQSRAAWHHCSPIGHYFEPKTEVTP